MQKLIETSHIRREMGGRKDLATMKNIYIHTQDEDLEIARKILTSSGQ